MDKETFATTIKGVAALAEAVDMIGAESGDDHKLAHVICDNELPLRELIRYALKSLGEDQ